MSAPKKYVVKATIESRGGAYPETHIELEGSGFIGKGEGYSIDEAFRNAYEDLMTKVSEAIFTQT